MLENKIQEQRLYGSKKVNASSDWIHRIRCILNTLYTQNIGFNYYVALVDLFSLQLQHQL